MDKTCRRGFTFGLVLHSLSQLQSSGRRYPPPGDLSFPQIPLKYWQPGAPVNHLEHEEEIELDYEHRDPR